MWLMYVSLILLVVCSSESLPTTEIKKDVAAASIEQLKDVEASLEDIASMLRNKIKKDAAASAKDVQVKDVQLKDVQAKDVQVKDMQLKDVRLKDMEGQLEEIASMPRNEIKKDAAALRNCIFPFTFDKITYHTCTNVDNDPKGPWCATKVDANGQMVRYHYQYCAKCVPLPLTALRNCIFPFTFDKITYHTCTNVDNDPKGPWCATKVDANGQMVPSHYQYCAKCVPLTEHPIVNEYTQRIQKVLVSEDEAAAVKNCPAANLKVETDYKFYIQRDDSKSTSTITYYDLEKKTTNTFSFAPGYSDHTHVEYDGHTLKCTGNRKRQSQCNRLPEGKAVPAIVLKIDFNPRSGSAHKNQWFRNQYSFSGGYYKAFCEATKSTK